MIGGALCESAFRHVPVLPQECSGRRLLGEGASASRCSPANLLVRVQAVVLLVLRVEGLGSSRRTPARRMLLRRTFSGDCWPRRALRTGMSLSWLLDTHHSHLWWSIILSWIQPTATLGMPAVLQLTSYTVLTNSMVAMMGGTSLATLGTLCGSGLLWSSCLLQITTTRCPAWRQLRALVGPAFTPMSVASAAGRRAAVGAVDRLVLRAPKVTFLAQSPRIRSLVAARATSRSRSQRAPTSVRI